MSAYIDLRSDLFRRAFAGGVPYRQYLATGNGREQAARAEAALPALPDNAQARLDAAGRIVNVLCLSGIWCGDYVRLVPIVARLAGAAGPSVDLRFVDRDAIPGLRDELRVLGAMRVPIAVFLTEGFPRVRPLRGPAAHRVSGEDGDGTRGRLPASGVRGQRGARRRDGRVAGRVRADDPDGPAGAVAAGTGMGIERFSGGSSCV